MIARWVSLAADWLKPIYELWLEEAVNAGAGIKALPRKLRKALGNGGRWLDAGSRERMTAFTESRPQLRTVCEFRARLATLMERNGRNGDALLDSLKQWCHEAEATGIRTLAEFAATTRSAVRSTCHARRTGSSAFTTGRRWSRSSSRLASSKNSVMRSL